MHLINGEQTKYQNGKWNAKNNLTVVCGLAVKICSVFCSFLGQTKEFNGMKTIEKRSNILIKCIDTV